MPISLRAFAPREPAIDILDVKTAGLTRHIAERRAEGKPIPGVFILPDRVSAIGQIIEWLLIVWTASESEEWRDQIVHVRSR